MKAAFAEVDITPPLGTKKGGWMEDLAAEVVLDPLYARVALFDSGGERVAFIQLDLLSIRWTHVNEIRQRLEAAFGMPGGQVMVACTHNHAGPATSSLAPVQRQEGYNEWLTQRCVAAFGGAVADLQEAECGAASAFEPHAAHNRRTLFRDGIVRSQRAFTEPQALAPEGPMDPEVAVLAVRDTKGRLLGCIVNYACHPVHHGEGNAISAGYPGVLAAQMKEHGCPVTLFLNGAYGNIITRLSKEEMGERLSGAVLEALGRIQYQAEAGLGAARSTLDVRYREITEDEHRGRVKGAQRFRSDELYEGATDKLLAQIAEGKQPKAEVQVLRVGERYYVGIPGEYFAEHGLRIKLESYPRYALVVGGANGMLGYLPTVEAFEHGGYETTLGPPSRMAAETGDQLADEAVRLIAEM